MVQILFLFYCFYYSKSQLVLTLSVPGWYFYCGLYDALISLSLVVFPIYHSSLPLVRRELIFFTKFPKSILFWSQCYIFILGVPSFLFQSSISLYFTISQFGIKSHFSIQKTVSYFLFLCLFFKDFCEVDIGIVSTQLYSVGMFLQYL